MTERRTVRFEDAGSERVLTVGEARSLIARVERAILAAQAAERARALAWARAKQDPPPCARCGRVVLAGPPCCCATCGSSEFHTVFAEGRLFYACDGCGSHFDRRVIIEDDDGDPG